VRAVARRRSARSLTGCPQHSPAPPTTVGAVDEPFRKGCCATRFATPPSSDPATTELFERWADEQLTDRMGIKITEWDPERLVATMPVACNRQPFGLLHGGASAVLAETLGSIAAALWSRPDQVPLGMELSC